jgi:dTDP-4-amino-4,6-dideoxygalactose transaminase
MNAVLTALVEDRIGPGEQAQDLIRLVKEQLGFEYGVASRSPVFALSLALRALDLEKGQGVLISALSPFYYLQVIERLGLRPVVCDVEPGQAVMGKKSVEAALARARDSEPQVSVRAIVARHTLGYTVESASLAETGLFLVEDISRSFGTQGIAAESGAASVWTILGLEERDMITSGGGALLFAANRKNATVLRNSFPASGFPPEIGLSDMNAAMAVNQLREASKNLARRAEIAQIYAQAAQRTRHTRFVTREGVEYNNYAFPLVLETGLHEVEAYARRKEIEVKSPFEGTLIGKGLCKSEDCPESYSLSLRTVIFPIYPRLSAGEVEKVARLIQTVP